MLKSGGEKPFSKTRDEKGFRRISAKSRWDSTFSKCKAPEKAWFNYHSLFLFSLILGCFLRFYQLGEQPLWLDEAASFHFSNKSILELWTVVPKYEPHPPVYYTLLRIWGFFGSSEAWLRSLSAIFSIACIPVIFVLGRLLGKPIHGSWIGAIAALIFSVSPVHIQYAQEARPYSMLTFAATLTLAGVLWAIRYPFDSSKPLLGKWTNQNDLAGDKSRKMTYLGWVMIIFGTALTLYSHNMAVLFILTLILGAIPLFLWKGQFTRPFLVNSILAGLIILLLWGPYVGFLLLQTKQVVGGYWISKPTIPSIVSDISWLLFGRTSSYDFSMKSLFKDIYFILATGIACAGVWNIRKRVGADICILILLSIAGPILMEIVFSYLLAPIFLDRTLIYVSVPFCIFIGAGIMGLKSHGKRAFVLVTILLVLLRWTHLYYIDFQKEPWDKIVQLVSPQEKSDDIVLLVPNNLGWPFSYYAHRYNKKTQVAALPSPFPAINENPGSSLNTRATPRMSSEDIPKIEALTEGKDSVWLITRMERRFDENNIVFGDLIQKRDLISIWRFNDISVYEFH